MRSFGGGKSGQNIFQILKWIDAEALASFDQAHDSYGSVSAFFGAGEQPVFTTQNQRLDASLAAVVADFHERMLKVDLKCRPAIEGVRNCFAKLGFRQGDQLGFVEPVFEHEELRLSEPLSEVKALSTRERSCDPLDVEQAFDHSHGELGSGRVFFPGVFKVAVNVCPAVCGSGTVLDDFVVLICAVGLKNSFKAVEDFLWIVGVLGIRVIVEDVWIIGIAAIDPNNAPVCFTETFFDDGQSGGVGLSDATFQNQLPHALNNRSKQGGSFFEPAAHRGAANGNTEGCKNLFLAIEGQVEPEFIGGNFSKETWASQPFIDWLVGFVSRSDLTAAVFAAVLKDDVLNILEEHAHELELVGDIEPDDCAWVPAARARNIFCIEMMLLSSCGERSCWCGTSAAFLWLRGKIEFLLFRGKLVAGGGVNGFASACEQGRIYFGRLLAESLAITATELFFKLGNAGEEFFDEIMAVGQVIGEFTGVMGGWFRGLFWHDLFRVATTIFYNSHYIRYHCSMVN